MNVSGIGKRTPALDSDIKVARQYRSVASRWTLDSNLAAGDKIILTGTIGDHGLAVLSAQQGLTFGSEIKSDVRPLNRMIQRLFGEVGGVVSVKDPTRGGLADALNEWAEKSKVGILTYEDKVPIRKDVQTACDMLGLDPLEVGNEGKYIIGVVAEKAQEALEFLKQTEEGKNAQIIGEATTAIQRCRHANSGRRQKNNCKTHRRPSAQNLLERLQFMFLCRSALVEVGAYLDYLDAPNMPPLSKNRLISKGADQARTINCLI